MSSTIGTFSNLKPKRAGSPGAGSRLKTGTVSTLKVGSLAKKTSTIATPMAVFRSHAFLTPPLSSAEKLKLEHHKVLMHHGFTPPPPDGSP